MGPMVSGSDDRTRRRRTGPRRYGLRGFEGWLEDVVLTGLEASVLGSPTLVIVVGTSALATERQHAALVALSTFALVVGTLRSRRGRFGSNWSWTMASAVLPRAIYYNAVLALAAYGGAAIESQVGVVAGTVFAASVAAIAGVRLPAVRAWTDRSLPYQRRVDDWEP